MPKVDYRLRPAKSIERKMIVQALRNLHPYSRMDDYRYVGFGSIYFTDFSLFHKALGIDDMISIERDTNGQDRYTANRPFQCISMKFGNSLSVLPSLKWDKPCIVWLDFESRIDQEVLASVDTVASQCPPSSVLIVTVNAGWSVADGDPVAWLRGAVGEEALPLGLRRQAFTGWGLADVSRTVVYSAIQSALSTRNGILANGDRLKFRDLFNFRYQEGSNASRMLTVGGLIHRDSDDPLIDDCKLDQLDFVRTDGTQCLIEVPLLTFRETRRFDTFLPAMSEAQTQQLSRESGVAQADINNYAKVYRYYPAFAEAEI